MDELWQLTSPADVQDKQNHQFDAEQVTVKSHVKTSLSIKIVKQGQRSAEYHG